MSYEVRNANISGTSLGVQCSDHGILSFYIHLNYGGSGQGFGGICLDTVNPKHLEPNQPMRTPTTVASSLLLAIDEVFRVDWEDLIGLPCKAYSSHNRVLALGHYLEDKWLWWNDSNESFTVSRFDDIIVL